MSLTPAKKRLRIALAIGVAGLATLAIGIGAVWRDASLSARPEVSGPVLVGWSENAATAGRIEIAGPDALFSLERTDEGWVMASRGGYRVRPERIAELDAALSGLRYAAAMTRDTDKFARLGLAAPGEGGDAVRLTVTDGEGDVLADLLIGEARGEDGLYLRVPGGERAFAVTGRMPELDAVDRWLGLDFFDLDPARVARAGIAPESGPAYSLVKAGLAARNFDLWEPGGWQLITSGAGNGVAVAGARVRFRDVRPADALEGAPVASHAGVTFDGIAYTYTFYALDEARWTRLEVSAAADDAAERAALLDAFAQGWAFEVSADAYERMTRPLDQLAGPIGPPG